MPPSVYKPYQINCAYTMNKYAQIAATSISLCFELTDDVVMSKQHNRPDLCTSSTRTAANSYHNGKLLCPRNCKKNS